MTDAHYKEDMRDNDTLMKQRKEHEKRFRMTTKNVAAFVVYVFFITLKAKLFIFSGKVKREEFIMVKANM